MPMTDTTPNAALAYAVLDQIEAHPENWDQAKWISRKAECGTSGCFAGWTAMLSGYKPVFANSTTSEATIVQDSADGEVRVSELAQQLLGARYHRLVDADGYYDEEDLFSEYHDFDDLRRLVVEMFGPRPEATA
jgi:hypothetical protein